MSKHTPGPWKACRSHETYDGTYFDIDPEDAAEYASRPFVRIEAPGGRSVFNASDLFEFSEADAHLIAAAPDLLAVAKAAMIHVRELREAWRTGAISEHDGQGGTRSNRNVEIEVGLRAAIAKAKGETP